MERLNQSSELEAMIARTVEKTLRDDPALSALRELLIEADTVTRAKGLNKKTISQNQNVDKYNAVGKRKLLLRLEDVSVLKNRKRKK